MGATPRKFGQTTLTNGRDEKAGQNPLPVARWLPHRTASASGGGASSFEGAARASLHPTKTTMVRSFSCLGQDISPVQSSSDAKKVLSG